MNEQYKRCCKCPNADTTVSFSNWHYCKKPLSGDFKILRHRDDFEGKPIPVILPEWCPYKREIAKGRGVK